MFGSTMRRHAGLLIVLIAAGGCGRGDGLVSLCGTVTLDGRPLEGATVHFIAQGDGGRDAIGTTDAEGEFELTTYQPGDGALPGRYKVIVSPPVQAAAAAPSESPADAMAASEGKPRNRSTVVLPDRYTQPGRTVLEQEVPSGGEVVFELTSK